MGGAMASWFRIAHRELMELGLGRVRLDRRPLGTAARQEQPAK